MKWMCRARVHYVYIGLFYISLGQKPTVVGGLTLTDKKETGKKEYGLSTLDLFREIKFAVDRTTAQNGESCTLVTAVEKAVGKDPRTVRLHLKILEESGYGHFAAGGKLFCKSASQSKDQNPES